MRKWVQLVLLSLLIGSCANPASFTRLTTHFITIDGADGCSATAVGPHTILTAGHCVHPGMALQIDGVPVKVIKGMIDGEDHALVIVGATFKWFARIGKPAAVRSHVYYYGNPGSLKDIYREGPVIGKSDETPFEGEHIATLYDINVFNGDSGAGIFDENGEVVSTVSYGLTLNGQMPFKVMGAFDFKFTASDYATMGVPGVTL